MIITLIKEVIKSFKEGVKEGQQLAKQRRDNKSKEGEL